MSYIIDCYNKNELCEKCHKNVVRFIYIEENIKRLCANSIKDQIKDTKKKIIETK